MKKQRAQKRIDVDLEGAWDPSTGMQWSKKYFLYPEVFRMRFDPDSIAKSPPLPVGVETVFKDVFGELANKKLKLALHPWFKRWCLFEFVPNPKQGQAGWHCVQIFHDIDSQKEGYLPADIDFEDKRAEDLRGRIGDYVPPNRKSLEFVKAHCDTHRSTVKEMFDFVISRREDKRKERASEHEAMLHDFHSYYFNHIRDMANIEEGSASKSMQCNQTSHDELDRRKWEREQAYIIEYEGVKHRVRRGSRHEQMVMDDIARKNQEKEAAQKKLIENSYVVEKELDRRNMLKQAKNLRLGITNTPKGHNGRTM